MILMILFALSPFKVQAREGDLSDNTTAEQIIQRIEDTYEAALRSAGRYRFQNRCSEMVNHSLYVLGLESYAKHCDGGQEYDLYSGIDKTSSGYDVVRYSAREYDLAQALYAVTEQEEGAVYNIIACWGGGSTGNSSAYGHTAFIHAIVDGMIYYSESYGLHIGGADYREGQPIVCSIEDFASYYNKWAYFEGVIYLDAPDEIPPSLSAVVVREKTSKGFTLNFRAKDNVEITEIFARVWTYGSNEKDAVTIPAQLRNGFAEVRVDTSRFDGFVGRYYILCYALDEKGNMSVASLVDGDCVDLYTSEAAEGTYQVWSSVAGVHNAPYTIVQGTGTLSYIMQEGTLFEIVGQYENDNGELWYQLAGGRWVNSAYVQRRIQWDEVQKYLAEMFAELIQG